MPVAFSVPFLRFRSISSAFSPAPPNILSTTATNAWNDGRLRTAFAISLHAGA